MFGKFSKKRVSFSPFFSKFSKISPIGGREFCVDCYFWLFLVYFRTKSDEKALNTLYFYFKNYPYRRFLEKKNGGTYKEHFQKFCSKSGPYRAPVFWLALPLVRFSPTYSKASYQLE